MSLHHDIHVQPGHEYSENIILTSIPTYLPQHYTSQHMSLGVDDNALLDNRPAGAAVSHMYSTDPARTEHESVLLGHAIYLAVNLHREPRHGLCNLGDPQSFDLGSSDSVASKGHSLRHIWSWFLVRLASPLPKPAQPGYICGQLR